MNNDYVEIEVEIIGETNKAFKLSDRIITEWVPKSQIEDVKYTDGKFAVVTIKEWVARAKGFL